MATAELEKDDDIVVLSFNGWLFEGYEDAKTALTGTILEELLVGAIDLLSEPGVVALGGQYANTQKDQRRVYDVLTSAHPDVWARVA